MVVYVGNSKFFAKHIINYIFVIKDSDVFRSNDYNRPIPFLCSVKDLTNIRLGNGWQIFIYYLLFLLVDGSVSIMAYIVEKEPLWVLLWIITQR